MAVGKIAPARCPQKLLLRSVGKVELETSGLSAAAHCLPYQLPAFEQFVRAQAIEVSKRRLADNLGYRVRTRHSSGLQVLHVTDQDSSVGQLILIELRQATVALDTAI